MSITASPIHRGFALAALLTLSAAGCAHRSARAKVPIAPARLGATETGVASWYGVPYHGRRAASGEIYDMEKLTAAHRKLPFQTWVEVTNLENGKRVDVRINDRGPFAHGRIIDLSQAAARDIDLLRAGTGRVRLKVIAQPTAEPPESEKPPASLAVSLFAVQAGAFADCEKAEELRTRLEDLFADARIVPGPRNLWRVIVGREMTMEQANELAARVRSEAGMAVVIAEPAAPQTSQYPQ
jgi:rare lipoprotein A